MPHIQVALHCAAVDNLAPEADTSPAMGVRGHPNDLVIPFPQSAAINELVRLPLPDPGPQPIDTLPAEDCSGVVMC